MTIEWDGRLRDVSNQDEGIVFSAFCKKCNTVLVDADQQKPAVDALIIARGHERLNGSDHLIRITGWMLNKPSGNRVSGSFLDDYLLDSPKY